MNKSQFEEFVSFLNESIKDTKYENHVYIVGGCVRDFLMDRDNINDVDIAVDIENGGILFANFLAMNDDSLELCKNPVLFSRTQCASLKLRNNPKFKDIEIQCTQTRKKPIKVDISLPMSQRDNNLGTIDEDALLRDLTINSIYLNVSTKMVIDPNNGVDDITNRILRSPSDGDIIFKDSPIRMLRIIRFASIYQWGIEKNTWMGIIRNCQKISSECVENISHELNKILLTDEPSYGLKRLMNSGLLFYILPELRELKNYYQLNDFKTVWTHTLNVVDLTQPYLPNRLSALFHDIGKPRTYRVINDTETYNGHETSGSVIANTCLSRLKYSNAIISTVQNVIKNHMRYDGGGTAYKPSNKSIRRFVLDSNGDIDVIMDVMNANAHCHLGTTKLKQFKYIKERVDSCIKTQEKTEIIIPITGDDIKKEFSIKEGKIIGQLLNEVKEEMFYNLEMTRDEALDYVSLVLSKIV